MPDHAHGTAAPVLLAQPFDHLAGVILFAGHIFIADQTVGIAGSGNVHTGTRIAMGGEPQMQLIVAKARHVPPTIGDVFQNDRHRC